MKKEKSNEKVKKENKEKKIKFKYPLLIIIIPLILIWIGIFTYNVKLKVREIVKNQNKANGYVVLVQEIGESVLLDPNKVKVTLKDDENNIIEEFTTFIRNNGKSINENDITINWLEEYVEVTLKGDEQKDDVHNINYKSENNN